LLENSLILVLAVLMANLDPSKLERVDEKIFEQQRSAKDDLAKKLNWLRAGVLGANDGIVSTAGLLMGVAGAGASSEELLVAGIAATVAGSISMAGGEYTSVSAQKDSEIAALDRERRDLAENPELELRELALYYEGKGISFELSEKIAAELTSKDALKAHAEAELGINPDAHVSPSAAALSSFISFFGGSLLPLFAVCGPWENFRIPAALAAVVASLAITGLVGARIGGAKPAKAVIRNVVISLLTMGITYAIGTLVGSAI
jgi:VIT1/CCC1 family predicted Fe2+/Mn2+ transporter